jgi:hypothetical protein
MGQEDYQKGDTQEAMNLEHFKSKELSGKGSPRCVDGRPTDGESDGPQMLGGSIHPMAVAALYQGADFNEQFVTQSLTTLKDKGFAIGAHRDDHDHGAPEQNSCGCGFADKLGLIVQAAKENKEGIHGKLIETYEANKDKMGTFSKPMNEVIAHTYEKLEQYPAEKLQLTGERLVRTLEQQGAKVEIVQGPHGECAAFVNLQEGTTFDTNGSNKEGRQAFNLDLWAGVEHSKALGVDEEFAAAASLVLYLATEIVLVEKNGKPALPVLIR